MTGSTVMGRLADDHLALARTSELDGFGMLALKPVNLAVIPRILESADAVEIEVANGLERVARGWVRRESWAGLWDRDPGRTTAGVLLEGEWALDGTASLSLIYDGRRWRLLAFEETDAGGVEVLREDVRLLGDDKRWLTYAVYWGSDETGSVRRMASRLIDVGGG